MPALWLANQPASSCRIACNRDLVTEALNATYTLRKGAPSTLEAPRMRVLSILILFGTRPLPYPNYYSTNPNTYPVSIHATRFCYTESMNKYKTIDEFLNDLSPDKKDQVLELRTYIKAVAPSLREHIKWNAPSFVKNGEDRITFNLFNKEGVVKLVFHMGATRKEDRKAAPVLADAQLIEWVSDIRGYVTFESLQQIKSQEGVIKELVKSWLAIG